MSDLYVNYWSTEDDEEYQCYVVEGYDIEGLSTEDVKAWYKSMIRSDWFCPQFFDFPKFNPNHKYGLRIVTMEHGYTLSTPMVGIYRDYAAEDWDEEV